MQILEIVFPLIMELIINYLILFQNGKITGVGSFNKDKLDKVIAKKPSNTNTAEKLIYSVRDQIVKAVSSNMFPDGVNFDSVINRLNE